MGEKRCAKDGRGEAEGKTVNSCILYKNLRTLQHPAEIIRDMIVEGNIH